MRRDQGPVTLAGISQRQKISLSHLEQLFGKLRRHESWKACGGRVAATVSRAAPRT